MNTAITRVNLPELLAISDLVEHWGVTISYSAYTQLRTGDPAYFITSAEDLDLLRSTVNRLIQLSRNKKHIANPETVFRDTVRYFERGGMQGCKAGRCFFVVMPDGKLVPCSLHRQRFESAESDGANVHHSQYLRSVLRGHRSYTDRRCGAWC
jgi:MoaA/NifB/PqqE/SkfB family radical SAM enzyme